MTVKYIAFDGTMFDFLYECKEYEEKEIPKSISNVKFYDKDNKLIAINEVNLDLIYEKAKRIEIPTKEDYDKLCKVFVYFNCVNRFPSEGTFYTLVSNRDSKISIVTREEFIKAIEELEKFLKVGK